MKPLLFTRTEASEWFDIARWQNMTLETVSPVRATPFSKSIRRDAATVRELPVAHDDPSDGNLSQQQDRPFMFDDEERATPEVEDAIDPHAMGLAIARWWLKARRLREEMFGPGLFADPAWDILLDLYSAEAKGQCVQISSLASAARVPHSTAIRWAKVMTRAGLMVRHKDPTDARRIHVCLSPGARALLEDFFARLTDHGQVPPQFTFERSR
jgi:DNA-binding MarR family transcriptional regulator